MSYRGRWITHRAFERNLAAAAQLYGYYRNPYTDDPSISDPKHPNRRTVSNTAPLVYGGKLFSLKEDGLPYELDPTTLDTTRPRGTANGAWKSETFSAHPEARPDERRDGGLRLRGHWPRQRRSVTSPPSTQAGKVADA